MIFHFFFSIKPSGPSSSPSTSHNLDESNIGVYVIPDSPLLDNQEDISILGFNVKIESSIILISLTLH